MLDFHKSHGKEGTLVVGYLQLLCINDSFMKKNQGDRATFAEYIKSSQILASELYFLTICQLDGTWGNITPLSPHIATTDWLKLYGGFHMSFN